MTQSTAAKTALSTVLTGPAGRALAEPIAEDLLGGLQHHLNMERQAHVLEAPNQVWESPAEVFATSFLMEADITASLHQLYALGEHASDVRTTVFLDPMVDQQTQAENEFAYLLGRVRFAGDDKSALLVIDNELYQGQHQPATLKD